MAKAKKKTTPYEAPPFTAPTWPATQVEVWPLAKIIPYPNNARSHPPEQIELLAKLMQKYGRRPADRRR